MGCEGVWVKVNPDSRGYTDTFRCSECGSKISLRAFDTECVYPHCPWCRSEMIDTIETVIDSQKEETN